MGRRTGQSGGEAAPPTLPLTTPLLTRWVWEHLIRGELAFEYPHGKGLRFLGREEKFQGAGWVRLLARRVNPISGSLTALAGFSLVDTSERVSGLSRTAWGKGTSN